MTIRSLICFVATAAIVTSFSTDSLHAQRNKPTWNGLTRFLGGGHSAGYHWRTPGPDVSYYNPYSRLNSTLRIGGVPQGAGPYIGGGCHQGCGQPFDQPSGFEQYSNQDQYSPQFQNPTQFAPSATMIDAEVVDDTDQTFDDDDISDLDDPTTGSSTRNAPESDTRNVPGSDTRNVPGSDTRNPSGSGTRGEVDETSLWPGFFEFGSSVQPQQRVQPAYGRPAYSASQARQQPVYDRRAVINQRFIK